MDTPQNGTTPQPEPKVNLQDVRARMEADKARFQRHRAREAELRQEYISQIQAGTASTRTLLSKQEAEDILTTLARVRANAKRRQEAERAKQEAERLAFLAGGGVCWTCRDTGHIPLTNEPCPECPHGQKVRAQRELRQVRAMLDASGMSERVREWTLASYPAQDNPKFAKVVDFLTHWDEHQSLMLVGPYGTGKTGLLAGLTREVATLYVAGGRPERRITWTTSVALMDALRAGYEDGTGAEKLERAKACSLLIIDDLGADKPKEWVLERLFTIINERYECKRPTFISTNYGIEELAERIGPRVLERLTETSRIIEVTGPNLRRRGNGGVQ